jgi:hypothetical protein
MPASRNIVLAVLLSVWVAGAVDLGLLDQVMPDAKMLMGANLAALAGSPLGGTLMSQAQSGSQQLGTLTKMTGFDPLRDLQEILVASTGEAKDSTSLVLARGSFDLAKISELAKQSGAALQTYQGIQVLAGKGKDDGWIAFLDRTTAAMGDAKAVKALLDRRGASAGPDPKLAARARQISQQYDFWVVSATPPTSLAGSVPDPQLSGIMQGDIFKGITETGGGVKFGPEILFGLEAVARSDKDAAALADVIRFFIGMAQMSAQKDPKAASSMAFLQKLDLRAEGNVMKMTLTIPQAEVEKMVKQAVASAQQEVKAAVQGTPPPKPRAAPARPARGGVIIYSSPSDMGTVVIK